MSSGVATSRFQEALETIERLPEHDQEALVEIVRKRLINTRRAALTHDVTESLDAFQRGDIRRGSAADLMAELAE